MSSRKSFENLRRRNGCSSEISDTTSRVDRGEKQGKRNGLLRILLEIRLDVERLDEHFRVEIALPRCLQPMEDSLKLVDGRSLVWTESAQGAAKRFTVQRRE